MGAISPLLGTAGGVNGTGVSGPSGTTISHGGITDSDARLAESNQQNSLNAQNGLLDALRNQNGMQAQTDAYNRSNNLAGQLAGNNGVQNQNNVFNQSQTMANQMAQNNGLGNQAAAMTQQQGLNGQLAQANGVGTQNAAISGLQNVAAQQQGLANQYGDVAAGRGPNPAQAMLNQQTGQNVSNQASLMAGQRGAGANVGLMARQAAQQGAATQQQAVGQAATMQANQSLSAMQAQAAQQAAMANTQQQIGGLGTTQVGAQQSGINAQGALAGQQVSQQQAQQQALAAQAQNQIGNQMTSQQAASNQANTMAGQQIAQTNANTTAQQAHQNAILQGVGNTNTANVNMQGNINSSNTSLANTNMQGQQAILGSAMNGLGGAVGMASGAAGGYVAMADGGDLLNPVPMPDAQPAPTPAPVSAPAAAAPQPSPAQPTGPQSPLGQFLSGMGNSLQSASSSAPNTASSEIQAPPQMGYGSKMLYQGMSSFGKAVGDAAKKAGSTAAMAAAAEGGRVEHDFRGGGKVRATSPTEKAVKPGNSYSNDKVKALLSEGEVVIPRSIMQSNDPERGAADFVRKVLAKRGVKAS